MSSRRNDCTVMTPLYRSWRRAKLTPADVGFMCATIARSAAPRRRRQCSITRATERANIPTGGLTLSAITSVFTITYVAEMLGEDVDWLHELSIDMFSEDGCLRVSSTASARMASPAFTEYGIECLKQIIADKRAAGGAPPPIR